MSGKNKTKTKTQTKNKSNYKTPNKPKLSNLEKKFNLFLTFFDSTTYCYLVKSK